MSFYKRTVTLPTIYEHQKGDFRIVAFAEARIGDLENEIEEAKLELQMWKTIMARTLAINCKECGGSGEVGHYPDGMADGMKYKRCPKCNGKGKVA